jgi:cytochrome o ubiquinol oxidase subunit 3
MEDKIMNEAVRERALLAKTSIGFWLYLMTDCVLFASLFATYAVLQTATGTGPTSHDLFELPTALTETIILLVSSYTCGIALVSMHNGRIKRMIAGFAATFALGLSFLVIEISEFVKFAAEGHSWQQSAFLSSFFTLVATHGLHITIGLLWLAVLLIVLRQRGFTDKLKRQITLFGLFWHFLDLVWIFIFTVVYLIGVAV